MKQGGLITQYLERFADGDPSALDAVVPLVYDELRALARRELKREADALTLATSDLVHEAYLNLARQQGANWHCRAQFFAVAGIVMRRILVDHARHKLRRKRGAGAVHLSLDEARGLFADDRAQQLLEVDDLLGRLAEAAPRAVRVVECRYFAGLSVDETAAALGISRVTVKRDWQMARAWLKAELQDKPVESPAPPAERG